MTLKSCEVHRMTFLRTAGLCLSSVSIMCRRGSTVHRTSLSFLLQCKIFSYQAYIVNSHKESHWRYVETLHCVPGGHHADPLLSIGWHGDHLVYHWCVDIPVYAAVNGNLDPTLSKTSPLFTFCHEIPRSRFTHHSPSLIEKLGQDSPFGVIY